MWLPYVTQRLYSLSLKHPGFVAVVRRRMAHHEASSPKLSTEKKPRLAKHKLIIDVDTGIDDAHAIMLALSRQTNVSDTDVDVLAITCANGNVKVDDVVENTLRVLKVCQRLDVPVYKGAGRSLLGKVSDFDNFSAPAWTTPVDRSVLCSDHAANALVRLASQFPGEITLVALAPLTNIAMAVNLDPDFPKKLKDIVIMGGNTDGRGRTTPCAEFNFFNDPEAANIVLNSFKSLRLLPYEVCCRHSLSWEFMEEWTGKNTPKSNFLRDSLEFDVKTAKSGKRQGYRTCDGFAMAAVVGEDVVTQEDEVYATVELSGEFTRGQMVVDWNGLLGREPNVRLIMAFDMARTQQLLMSMI